MSTGSAVFGRFGSGCASVCRKFCPAPAGCDRLVCVRCMGRALAVGSLRHARLWWCFCEAHARIFAMLVGLSRDRSKYVETRDSQASGAAERAVQALGEQVSVLRQGLEGRLGIKLQSSRPVVAWMVEHAAAVLSKYEVGADGRTAYERMKGRPCSHEMAEFGERNHNKFPKGTKRQKEKLDGAWGEGYFLGHIGGRARHLWGASNASVVQRRSVVLEVTADGMQMVL